MSLVAITIPAKTDRRTVAADLTVHEWGAFTSVAGDDGRAMDWLALGGASDLPCFVERVFGPQWVNKLTLMAKVRMETPVLYFYSPRATKVTTKVRFPQGLLTEWYPQVTHTATRGSAGEVTALEWSDVQILPETNPGFPAESRASHYYTARNTDAAPLRTKGQDEKFLFYRGVGSFEPPISVRLLTDGKVAIKNLGDDPIPFAVLFQNRGGRVEFRDLKNLTGTTTLDPLTLNHDANPLWVRDTLAKILVASGLYGREAAAMVDTWRDSWFEEGMRVFYIVPPRTVDSILPLDMDPQPAQMVRAFVGRMEIITPEMENAVAAAIRTNDEAMLERYGRFLAPIADRLLKTTLPAEDRAAIQSFIRRATDRVFVSTSPCK